MCSTPLLRIVGISGSLRKASTNSGLLRAAAQHFPPHVQFTIADVDLPLYNGDLDNAAGRSARVTAFCQLVAECDGILFACPEYNYSVSGVLKNAIDWASRKPPTDSAAPLDSKPYAVMGAGGGMGSGRAQYHLRQIMCFPAGIPVIKPEVFVKIFEAPNKFDGNGELIDADTSQRVKQLVETLINHVIVEKEKPKAITEWKAKHGVAQGTGKL